MSSDFVRGTQAVFEADFFDFDGSPMIPADPESWPAVSITDPDETVVATGVGLRINDGKYRFTWFVPTAATLASDGTSWSISWSFVTNTGNTRTAGEKFGVVDRIEARTDALRRLVDALEKEVVQTEQKRSLLDKETTGQLFEGFQAAVSARDAVRAGDADGAAVHIDSLIATLQTLISRLNPQPGADD